MDEGFFESLWVVRRVRLLVGARRRLRQLRQVLLAAHGEAQRQGAQQRLAVLPATQPQLGLAVGAPGSPGDPHGIPG